MTDVIVAFVDVGQGDCIIAVDRESGGALMIDCPQGRHSDAVTTLQTYGAKRLEAAVVTHQHLDHLGGVYSTVTSFPTSSVRMNPVSHVPADPDEHMKLRAALRALRGLPRHNVTLTGADFGDEGGIGKLQWKILAPDHSQLFSAQADNNPNHASVVMMLSVGTHRILTGSDADTNSWAAIMTRNLDIKADVFQLPHHGARMVSNGNHPGLGELLDAVQASYYVISVGSQNGYGHPAVSTLGDIRARREHAQTFCTQLNAVCAGHTPGTNVRCAGTVAITFQENKLVVSPSVIEHSAAVSRLPAAQCI